MQRDTAEAVVAKLRTCAGDLNEALHTILEGGCTADERAYFKREIARLMNAIDQHLNQRIWNEYPDLDYLSNAPSEPE
jgi:hypothetical protein